MKDILLIEDISLGQPVMIRSENIGIEVSHTGIAETEFYVTHGITPDVMTEIEINEEQVTRRTATGTGAFSMNISGFVPGSWVAVETDGDVDSEDEVSIKILTVR
jgi:hypothetical protein